MSDNGGPPVVLTQSFDAAGNRLTLAAEVDEVADFLNTYSYDNLRRMTRIEQEGQSGGNTVAEKRVDLAFNAAGQFTAIDRYKDTEGGSINMVVASTFDYDLIGRLTDLTHTYDTTDIADYHWDYDAFSRITFFGFAFSAGDDGSSAFDYDATGQLIVADHTAQTDEAFAFDENGNRTMSGYVTGDNNLVLSDGEFNYLYDPEGNRLSKTRISNDPADDKTVEYEWDHRNRLTAVFFKNNQGSLTAVVLYQYDVFNRRTRKIIDRDGVGQELAEQIDFIYDGQNIVLALDGEGSLTNRYLHGPGVDQILADEQVGGAGVLWTLSDNQGSVRDLVENDGDVASHIDYTAFGRVETETDPGTRTFYGWTGRERDTETGLNYHRARFYDPVLGRWISEDPIGFKGGDWNLDRLTGNDPINFTDPSGLIKARAIMVSPYSKKQLEEMDVHPHFINEFERLGGQFGASCDPTATLGLPPGTTTEETTISVWDATATVLVIRDANGDVLWYAVPEIANKWRTVRSSHKMFASLVYGTGELLGLRDEEEYVGSALVGWRFHNRLEDVLWNLTGPDKLKAMQTLAQYYGLGSGALALARQASRLGVGGLVPTGSGACTVTNSTRGWYVGQPINNLTRAGRVPSWTAVRARFWKNEAFYNVHGYSEANLERMRRGLAPQRLNPVTGAIESRELHHIPAQRTGGRYDFVPLWPDEHAIVDPFRNLGS